MTTEPKHSLLKNAPETGFILDAGCNNFFYTNILKNDFRNIICIDINEPEKSLARENLFTLGSIEKLPYKNNTFDFIYCFSVIQFINNDRSVFEEFYRVLKPEGKLLITVPTCRSPFRIIREMEIRYAVYKWSEYNLAHHHYYSIEDIEKLTCDTFRIKSVLGYNYNFIPRLLWFLFDVSKQKKWCSGTLRYNSKKKNKNLYKTLYPLSKNQSTRASAANIFHEFAYHFIILLEKENLQHL
jgi:SAM-dependent methyltransferase